MNASRILAVARRIAQGFRRDERTLGLIFVVPIVITALLGWVIRDQKELTVGVVIVNEAGPPGQRIVDALTIGDDRRPGRDRSRLDRRDEGRRRGGLAGRER